MQNSSCTKPELKIPSRVALERLRVYSLAQHKEALRQRKLAAARRALSIVQKLPAGEFRAKHVSRIFRNMNKLRAA